MESTAKALGIEVPPLDNLNAINHLEWPALCIDRENDAPAEPQRLRRIDNANRGMVPRNSMEQNHEKHVPAWSGRRIACSNSVGSDSIDRGVRQEGSAQRHAGDPSERIHRASCRRGYQAVCGEEGRIRNRPRMPRLSRARRGFLEADLRFAL